MANPTVSVALRETAYRLPDESRQAILALAQTDYTRISNLATSTWEIAQQRQQFIEMHGDAFGSDASD